MTILDKETGKMYLPVADSGSLVIEEPTLDSDPEGKTFAGNFSASFHEVIVDGTGQATPAGCPSCEFSADWSGTLEPYTNEK